MTNALDRSSPSPDKAVCFPPLAHADADRMADMAWKTPALLPMAYTVDGFAEAFNISRSLLYALWKRKEGPVFYYAGNKRFISFVEARRWQETREQMAILRHAEQRPQLRLRRRSLPHIARWHREPAHLRDRLAAQPKNASRFPPALAIIENKLSDRSVNLHDKHPFGFPSS